MLSRNIVDNASQCYDPNIQIQLQEAALWQSFYHCNNEMIINREGRKMFPVISVSISGLQSKEMYAVVLQFQQVTKHRWKFNANEWSVSGLPSSAKECRSQNFYCHHNSPAYGHVWMGQPISFGHVRLTNQRATATHQAEVSSLHKYEPVVKVFLLRSFETVELVCQHRLHVCQFVAVTAYQNDELTALKVRYNPFAKSVSDSREKKRKVAALADSHHQLHSMRDPRGSYGYNIYPGMLPYVPYNHSSVPVIPTNTLPVPYRHSTQHSNVGQMQNQYENNTWYPFQVNDHQEPFWRSRVYYQPCHYNYSPSLVEAEEPKNVSIQNSCHPMLSPYQKGVSSNQDRLQYPSYSNTNHCTKEQHTMAKASEDEISRVVSSPMDVKSEKTLETNSDFDKSFLTDSGYFGSYPELSNEGFPASNIELSYPKFDSLNYTHPSEGEGQGNPYFYSTCDYSGYNMQDYAK